MFAMTSYFSLPEQTDWESMRELARTRAIVYQSVPGLRAKAFIVDPERRLYGANYVWESREAIDRFLSSELFAGIVAKLGQPEMRIFEVPAYVEQGELVAIPDDEVSNAGSARR
ncbi:MAG: DUF4865 family protein [Acidimicrobiia bacterium]